MGFAIKSAEEDFNWRHHCHIFGEVRQLPRM